MTVGFYMRVAAFATLMACSHSQSPAPDLATSLILEHERVGTIRLGTNIDLASSIRNGGTRELEICVDDSTVSAWLEGEASKFKWPIILGGLVLDAECAGRTILSPGERLDFRSKGGVFRGLPAGDAVLHLSIRVSYPTGGALVRIGTEERVTLLAP
jgi:hypothetical protein